MPDLCPQHGLRWHGCVGLSHGHRLLGQEVWLHVGWGQKRHVRAQGLAGQLSLVLGGAATHTVHFCHIVFVRFRQIKKSQQYWDSQETFLRGFYVWAMFLS